MRPIEPLKNRKEMQSIRRELRKNVTAAENTLWKMLKRKQIANIRFLRQYSIGRFVADFYSPELNLVIELDGQGHFTPEGQEYDAQRTEFIEGATGATVIRFENRCVYQNPEMIIEAIMGVKEERELKKEKR